MQTSGPAGPTDQSAQSGNAAQSGTASTAEIPGAAGGRDQPEALLDDRYELGSCMGGGGMADVYRATDVRLHRSVAVKVFRSGADRAGRARFEDEAKLLARLNHPGLVPVHDASATGPRPYLVMQLVEGETLEEVLERGALPADRIAEIGHRLSEVLAYVHDNGIVHRDVKPSNVLISRDDRVFLADFGVSRLVDAVGRMTSAGIVMGTTTYMSPEQVRDGDIGFATDVYSLGLVLLECATGEREYPGVGAETAVARLSRPPLIPEELPEPLAGALRAMTVDEAHLRPSARRCAAILAGQEEPPAAVAPQQVPEPVESSPSESHRLWWVLAVGAALAALVVTWLLLPTAPVEPAVPLPPVHGPPGLERLPEDLANLEELVQR